jgi:Fe2+ transport system protein FeoA
MTLAHARVGERVTVERVGGERAFRRRLMELGLVPGTQVEMIGVAPLGDPLELLVRGCSLSIRRGEALWVSVRRAPSGAASCCGTTAVSAEVPTAEGEPVPACGSCGTR